MTDDLERQLGAAFDAHARATVRDDAPLPAPRFLDEARPHRRRWLAPVAAAAAVLAVAGSVLGLQAASDDTTPTPAAGHSSTPPPVAGRRPVPIRLAAIDGATYGVGMPVVAYFTKRFATAKPLADATSVTINGKPVQTAWYFERSAARGFPIEGHLRMREYWPAHSYVRVVIAANAATRGAIVAFHTSARTVAIVSDAKHQMVVTRDGKTLGSFPVSLGTAATPTARGTKVIMAKKPSICLSGPGFNQCGVKYAQQLTADGEYLIAAPWNPGVKGHWDASNGCTNLTSKDAQFLYRTMQVGDIVQYPDASGAMSPSQDGYGDWNIPWSTWLRGGLISTG